MNKADKLIAAAEHIKRVCPNDIGGQMVLVAFAQDAIDHEEPDESRNSSHRFDNP